MPDTKDSKEQEVQEQPESPPPATPRHDDPLAEVPDALWYVAPPGGGQFGPAKADVMRTWIDDGRVTGDALLWREGWEDWVTASEVLPQLVTGATTSETVEGADSSTSPGAEPTEVNVSVDVPRARPVARRRRVDRNKTAKVVGGLTALVVVLAILLFWVLSRS